MHCTPPCQTRQTGGGRRVRIDSGRWRRGHRLALLGVMTLTQCSAMASSSPTLHHLWSPFSRRRRGEEGVEKTLRSRVRGSRGWRVSRRSVSASQRGINQLGGGGEGWKGGEAEKRAIVKCDPSSSSLPSERDHSLPPSHHPLQSSDADQPPASSTRRDLKLREREGEGGQWSMPHDKVRQTFPHLAILLDYYSSMRSMCTESIAPAIV